MKITIRIQRSLAVALTLATATLHAADLVEILRAAQVADSTYGAARAAWAAAQEKIPQGRAGLLPTVSLNASAQRENRRIEFRDATQSLNRDNFNSSTVTLAVTQPLLRLQNAIAYAQAFTQAEQADAQLAVAGQDLVLRTAQAYFDVLLAQDNVAFAEAQKTAISQQLGQARRNFEVGTAAITDVHEAQARFDLTSAQEIAARNEYELRRRALEQIIGREPPSLAPLGATFSLKAPAPNTVDPWLSLAAQNNLQVRVSNTTLVFSAQEIERNRAAHMPTLDAFANISNSGSGAGIQGGVGNDTRNRMIGLQFALPIYSGGLVSSRVREAVANEERARQELETAKRAAVFNARQAFLGITNGTALVTALEAGVSSTQSQLTSTRVGQQVGVRTLVDVLNAQQLLFSARRDLAQAKYNYIMSLLRLEAAIGELTESDVVAVNEWLDRAVLGQSEGPANWVSDRLLFPTAGDSQAEALPARPIPVQLAPADGKDGKYTVDVRIEPAPARPTPAAGAPAAQSSEPAVTGAPPPAAAQVQELPAVPPAPPGERHDNDQTNATVVPVPETGAVLAAPAGGNLGTRSERPEPGTVD